MLLHGFAQRFRRAGISTVGRGRMSTLTAGAGEQAAASDEALMEAYARRGDSTAFEQFYER